MYKLLLAWRYLRTRYIALASIISVTLGVATLIVVNSVMSGFANEMNKRLHGILSDLTFESYSLGGLPDPQWHMDEIRKVAGEEVVGMTATVQVPAMLSFQLRGRWVTKQVNLIGIDEATYAQVGDFSQFLQHPENRKKLSFQLQENGYEINQKLTGWEYRRFLFERRKQLEEEQKRLMSQEPVGIGPPADPTATLGQPPAPPTSPPVNGGELEAGPPAAPTNVPGDPYGGGQVDDVFDDTKEQHTGLIAGMLLASLRRRNAEGEVEDYYLFQPGDNVNLTFPNAGTPPKAINMTCTVVDLYESEMAEYDSKLVFMPLSKLQDMRDMLDRQTGMTSATSIQIKLRPGADLNAVRDKLQERFPMEAYAYSIRTWQDMQGPLLAAVQMETTILNILLFFIIAVAGFGILATFFMIVVEKTRDIGVLKALGAPNGGVMSIFLSYGCSLGTVGAGVGTALGLLFVVYINEVADLLERITGQDVFDPTVYYFENIPTIIEPFTVVMVAVGAILIAVMASVLPAMRAARLHPVEALRYE